MVGEEPKLEDIQSHGKKEVTIMEDEIIYKDICMERFKALSEKEQKDLLFIIADLMDQYAENLDKLTAKKKKTAQDKQDYKTYKHVFVLLQMLSDCQMETPEFMKAIGIHENYSLKMARKMRTSYENEKKGRSA